MATSSGRVPQRYPPLTLRKVIAILTSLGFEELATTSGTSHRRWHKMSDGQRRSVIVDEAIPEFSGDILRIMIRDQAKLTRDEFYSGCKSAARKVNVKPRHNAH